MVRRIHTEFGSSVLGILQERGMTQSELASAVGRSNTYTSEILTGKKTASAEWANLVAAALNLQPEERNALHLAAAKDHGFELPLFHGTKTDTNRTSK